MKRRPRVALFAALAAGAACAQDINVYSTTISRMWKQDVPGFTAQSQFNPLTEFLGVDATKLGTDALSVHLFGWGTRDYKDATTVNGHTDDGALTYGYMEYDFDKANAQVKAGRFTVNQGVGNEVVDGVYARTDLRGGFAVSGFMGAPVIFRNHADNPQGDITAQRSSIFGARLSWDMNHYGEIGLSYLQDGTTNTTLSAAVPYDYTRKQVGVDLKVMPFARLDVSGRTVFDVASHPAAATGEKRSDIAEHDYNATLKAADSLSFTGTYVERNFYAYFAGSTLPSLFNQNEKGLFRATGLAGTWGAFANFQLTADVRRTDRELYGTSTRAGFDGRYRLDTLHVLAGAGYHKINAFHVVAVDPLVPSFSMSHSESRAWLIYENGKLSASLDGIRLHYADAYSNPSLNGRAIESQLVGSLGWQALKDVKVSADLSYADTPLHTKQTMGLVRVEWHFGYAGKGGK